MSQFHPKSEITVCPQCNWGVPYPGMYITNNGACPEKHTVTAEIDLGEWAGIVGSRGDGV